MLNKKFLFLFLVMPLFYLNCEKDDICASTTSTTPHLIIRFYDINNPSQLKSVRQLSVVGVGDNMDLIINSKTTDSIALPLKFNEENIYTSTEFNLKKDSDYDNDSNTTTASNTDVIKITTLPFFEYVSRACGYRSIFQETKINIIEDDSNWIFNYEIVNDLIENERKAHIKIYH